MRHDTRHDEEIGAEDTEMNATGMAVVEVAPFGLTRPLYQFDSYKLLCSSEGRFDLLIYKSRSD